MPFHGVFTATVFVMLCFLFMILLLKAAAKYSAECISVREGCGEPSVGNAAAGQASSGREDDAVGCEFHDV